MTFFARWAQVSVCVVGGVVVVFCFVQETVRWFYYTLSPPPPAPPPTDLEAELARYDGVRAARHPSVAFRRSPLTASQQVIFFESAACGSMSIESGNRERTESLIEAKELDVALRKVRGLIIDCRRRTLTVSA